MKLGISSYTYAWAIGVPKYPPDKPMTAFDLLKKASDLGVYLVQIADNLPLDKMSSSEINEFEELASSFGINIEVGTRGIRNNNLGTYLQIAERFKSPILRVVIDTDDHQPDEDEIVNTIQTIINDFERKKIVLAIENHDRFSAKTLARIIHRIGSDYVGICFDTVNSFGALESTETVLMEIGDMVVNLHIKDFSIQRVDYNQGFIIEGRPAGKGRLDIPLIIKELHRRGRDPNAILELWTPPDKNLTATIEKEDLWAKLSIEYLNGLLAKRFTR